MTLRHSLDVEADGAVIEHGFDTGRRNRVSVWLYRLETALTSGITLALSVFLEYLCLRRRVLMERRSLARTSSRTVQSVLASRRRAVTSSRAICARTSSSSNSPADPLVAITS